MIVDALAGRVRVSEEGRESEREGGGVLIANSEPWREIFFSLGALAHIFSLAAAAEGLAVF